MNLPVAVLHRSRAAWSFTHPGLWRFGMLMLLLLASSLMFLPAPDRPASAVEIQPLVHFRDASHDWLMVVDPATREVVVYDATSGRPLHRLGADEGWYGVKSIAREGSRLLLTGDNSSAVRVLTLPEFQPVVLNDR